MKHQMIFLALLMTLTIAQVPLECIQNPLTQDQLYDQTSNIGRYLVFSTNKNIDIESSKTLQQQLIDLTKLCGQSTFSQDDYIKATNLLNQISSASIPSCPVKGLQDIDIYLNAILIYSRINGEFRLISVITDFTSYSISYGLLQTYTQTNRPLPCTVQEEVLTQIESYEMQFLDGYQQPKVQARLLETSSGNTIDEADQSLGATSTAMWQGVNHKNLQIQNLKVPKANLQPNTYYWLGVNITEVAGGKEFVSHSNLGPFNTVTDNQVNLIPGSTNVLNINPRSSTLFSSWVNRNQKAYIGKQMIEQSAFDVLFPQLTISWNLGQFSNVKLIRIVIMRQGNLQYYQDVNWFTRAKATTNNFCTGYGPKYKCPFLNSDGSLKTNPSPPNTPTTFFDQITGQPGFQEEYFAITTDLPVSQYTFEIDNLPSLDPYDNAFDVGIYVKFNDDSEQRQYQWLELEGPDFNDPTVCQGFVGGTCLAQVIPPYQQGSEPTVCRENPKPEDGFLIVASNQNGPVETAIQSLFQSVEMARICSQTAFSTQDEMSINDLWDAISKNKAELQQTTISNGIQIFLEAFVDANQVNGQNKIMITDIDFVLHRVDLYLIGEGLDPYLPLTEALQQEILNAAGRQTSLERRLLQQAQTFEQLENSIPTNIVSQFWNGVTSKDVKTKQITISGDNLQPNSLYLIGVKLTDRQSGAILGQSQLGPIRTMGQVSHFQGTIADILQVTPQATGLWQKWSSKNGQTQISEAFIQHPSFSELFSDLTIKWDLSSLNDVATMKFTYMRPMSFLQYQDMQWAQGSKGIVNNFCVGYGSNYTCPFLSKTGMLIFDSAPETKVPYEGYGLLSVGSPIPDFYSEGPSQFTEYYSIVTTDRTGQVTVPISELPSLEPNDNYFLYGLYIKFNDGTEQRAWDWFGMQGPVFDSPTVAQGVSGPQLDTAVVNSCGPNYDCNGHGTCDPQKLTCNCGSGWSGLNCNNLDSLLPSDSSNSNSDSNSTSNSTSNSSQVSVGNGTLNETKTEATGSTDNQALTYGLIFGLLVPVILGGIGFTVYKVYQRKKSSPKDSPTTEKAKSYQQAPTQPADVQKIEVQVN